TPIGGFFAELFLQKKRPPPFDKSKFITIFAYTQLLYNISPRKARGFLNFFASRRWELRFCLENGAKKQFVSMPCLFLSCKRRRSVL
ncbi:MAG: hypothetical protein IKV00_02205, partial [Clostridia bacterium]|nr:hypothetical protein [Clostridia bacterium]